jgi:hypothetical protein
LAPNKHPHPLPPFQYVILLKKGGKSVQKEGGLGQDPQNKRKKTEKINRKDSNLYIYCGKIQTYAFHIIAYIVVVAMSLLIKTFKTILLFPSNKTKKLYCCCILQFKHVVTIISNN